MGIKVLRYCFLIDLTYVGVLHGQSVKTSVLHSLINSDEVEIVFPSEEGESLRTTYTCTCHAIWFPLLQEHHH